MLYFSKDVIFTLKSNYLRPIFLLVPCILLVTVANLPVASSIFGYLKSAPVIQRLLWTVDGGLAQDGRIGLVRTFLEQYDFFVLFGGYVNAAKFTGGLESFHNLILDAFWYAGWIGGVAVILGLTLLVLRFVQSKTYIGLVMVLFIIAGLLLAAPPFSNQFAFALVLPLFLEYLRCMRTPISKFGYDK